MNSTLSKRIYHVTCTNPREAKIARTITVGILLDEVINAFKPPPRELAEVLPGIKVGGSWSGNFRVCRGTVRRWNCERGIGRKALARVVGFKYGFEGVEVRRR
jgi:hypothetical protein